MVTHSLCAREELNRIDKDRKHKSIRCHYLRLFLTFGKRGIGCARYFCVWHWVALPILSSFLFGFLLNYMIFNIMFTDWQIYYRTRMGISVIVWTQLYIYLFRLVFSIVQWISFKSVSHSKSDDNVMATGSRSQWSHSKLVRECVIYVSLGSSHLSSVCGFSALCILHAAAAISDHIHIINNRNVERMAERREQQNAKSPTFLC